MNYIFYQTKTKFSNTGDALINRSLIERLRNYGTLFANCTKDIPENFIKELGIEENERIEANSEFEFVKIIIKYAIKAHKEKGKVFIFSGLGDSFGGNKKAIIRNYIATLIFMIYRLFGVKIIRIGRSIGPITRSMAISEKVRSTFVNYYYVRDTASLKKCKDIGIKKSDLCPDMSWLYSANEKSNINDNNIIMINLRNSIFDDVDDKYVKNLIQKCKEVVQYFDKALNNKMEIILTYQVDEDREFEELIYNELKNDYKISMVSEKLSLKSAEKFYSKTIFNISNRMHSLLFSFKYGSLPIALIDTNNHVKIAATFKDCGLEELMIDLYNEKYEEKINNIIKNKGELFKKIKYCENNNRKKIIEILNNIFEK